MKNFAINFLSILLLGMLLIQCNEEPTPTGVSQDNLLSMSKIIVNEYTFDATLDLEPPYEDCATGEDMQNHGTVKVYIVERITPSGNVLVNGWVDYNAYGEVTLENLGNGDIWTLTNGHNPFHEVIKENGFYVLSYHWNELYKLDNQTLHILLKGHVKIEADGTVTIDRESYTCQ